MAGGLNYKGLNAKKASAVGVALVARLLQNDDVRKALGGAGAGLTAWSKRTRARFDAPLSEPVRPRRAAAAASTPFAADDPRGSPTLDADSRQSCSTAEVELRRAAFVAGEMPVSERVPAQRSIPRRLDKLEHALIDAVL